VESRLDNYRGTLSIALIMGACLALLVSWLAWNICEVNCTFARQKALMYLAVPAVVASLLTLAATQAHKTVWWVSFGMTAVLLATWLAAALVISP
jgi:hypothetical protein